VSGLVAATSPSAYWYVTRGTGAVALLLLTAATVLGVATTTRVSSPRWPRFVVAGLHRNLTLLAVAFVAAHVLTTVADGYTRIGLRDAFLPFLSSYRPFWLGLGAVAFDLLLALVVTSLLRARLGVRLWRGVHWLAYAAWPVALFHALGTGSDARSTWMRLLGLASLAAVAGAVLWRAAAPATGAPRARLSGALAAVVVPLAIVAWYQTGPLRRGWAARAGTPAALLAGGASTTAAPSVSGSAPGSESAPGSSSTTGSSSARQPFAGRIHGSVSETPPDATGFVTVAIRAALPSNQGVLRLMLRGTQLENGGVAMSSSDVRLDRRGNAYTGHVVGLAGPRVEAVVRDRTGSALRLDLVLRADVATGNVEGVVRGGPPGTQTDPEQLRG
jgi:sulfoxide reductase heme-binding subunit YedZ